MQQSIVQISFIERFIQFNNPFMIERIITIYSSTFDAIILPAVWIILQYYGTLNDLENFTKITLLHTLHPLNTSGS